MSEQPRRRRRQMSGEELNNYCTPEQRTTFDDTEKKFSCPEQTTQYSPASHSNNSQNGANGLSIAGFVVSLVSLFILGLYGVTGTIGLILSAIGRSHAVSEGRKTGLATAGIILGIISIMGGLVNAIIYL